MATDNIYVYGQYSGNPKTTSESNKKTFNDALYIPNWSAEEYIKLRTKFARQGIANTGNSPFNERGTYFYKLFINFDTSIGLFGNILEFLKTKKFESNNNAMTYLTYNTQSSRFSEKYRSILHNKLGNLFQFTGLLNYILEECPWFIKEVGGLGDTLKYNFNEIALADEKRITVSFNDDAIDMRVSTLFDLYRNIVYDVSNQKEIIPENLRKFDIAIIMFNSPIGEVNFGENIKDISYRCIVLKNCEFVLESLANIPDVMNNEIGFQGQYNIEIAYQRAYSYTLNKELLKYELFDTKQFEKQNL